MVVRLDNPLIISICCLCLETRMQYFFGRYLMLLILFLANSFLLGAQSKRDTITISNYIVKQGNIFSYTEFHAGISDPSNCINIITTEDSAFSVSDGIVKSFFKVYENDYVMIESKGAWFTLVILTSQA